jgi:hypothetical protein
MFKNFGVTVLLVSFSSSVTEMFVETSAENLPLTGVKYQQTSPQTIMLLITKMIPKVLEL